MIPNIGCIMAIPPSSYIYTVMVQLINTTYRAYIYKLFYIKMDLKWTQNVSNGPKVSHLVPNSPRWSQKVLNDPN